MKISIQTLGCKVNQAESASIEGMLRDGDHEIVSARDKPDLCIVNTCTVTAKSDYESRQIIRRALRSGARVIATGCYAQLRPGELSSIEGLDLILGNAGKQDILQHLSSITSKERCRTSNTGAAVRVASPDFLLAPMPYRSTRSRAFLKIQDGCNFSCTYCSVPHARGRSRSLGISEVLRSAERLYQDGYREIVLTGIHIGSYGLDLSPQSSLSGLVDGMILSCPDARIRLSSLEPQEVKDEFLTAMEHGTVCSHLHIPLQSGSDNILKLMNRGYNSTYYKQLINKIVTKIPHISIGADVIVGFPGESDKDFSDTVNFIRQLPLSYLHVFPYSKRPDTAALELHDHIPEAMKKKRVEVLVSIGKSKKQTYMEKFLDREVDIIVEGKSQKEGYMNAISDNYLKILLPAKGLHSRQRLRARVFALSDSKLIAQPLIF